MRVLVLAASLLLTGCSLFLAGCSLSPSASFIEALGKDPATVSLQINSVYGRLYFCRTAILNGNVTCNADGISLKTEAASVGVPMTIVPQINIGPPVLTPNLPVAIPSLNLK